MLEQEEPTTVPDRNLAVDLVRVTEAAAMAAGRWIGRGDPVAADDAAHQAMTLMLSTVPIAGTIVVGEGDKEEVATLYRGQVVGDGQLPAVDVALNAIDGAGLTSRGEGDALSVAAVSERGTIFDPGPSIYMKKLACGPDAADVVDLDAPPEENVGRVAKAKGVRREDVSVTILARPRHVEIINAVRRTGARVFLITDGDVAGAINAAMEDSGIDLLLGTGRSREGVLAACALKCLGGRMLCQLAPQTLEERMAVTDAGLDVTRIYDTDDLVSSDNVFFATTGVTDGRLLRGVRYRPGRAITDSLVMRSKSGTMRRIEAVHRFSKLMRFSGIDYES